MRHFSTYRSIRAQGWASRALFLFVTLAICTAIGGIILAVRVSVPVGIQIIALAGVILGAGRGVAHLLPWAMRRPGSKPNQVQAP